jgi:hypothetical protein
MTVSARAATLALLSAREPQATICPSEVARTMASKDSWRDVMPEVHAAVDRLFLDGLIQLSWKGAALATRSGPYRIGRANED